MKTIFKTLLLILSAVIVMSCEDKIEETYIVNTPVYMGYDELRTSFKVAEPENIIQPGKIYFKDNFIYVNEYRKGIHVVNNTDPANPQVIKFIEIPGNVDIAIKGDFLYADSYVDLVTIDISDINNIQEVDRDSNIFPYIIPEYEDGRIDEVNQEQGVIVNYTQRKVTEELKDVGVGFNRFNRWGGMEFDAVLSNSVSIAPGAGTQSNTGTGGSMARFTIYEQYLYTINDWGLKLFDLGELSNPEFLKEQSIGWRIETLFPYKDKLFIGAQSGMYIYSLDNPAEPTYIAQFTHATACDPVVVNDNYAYVTLRGGTTCNVETESRLEVIDITNIETPKLKATYSMEEPYGLGIDDSVLFICDGDAGLKIYNANDPNKIAANKIIEYPDVHAFDVIPLGSVLVMIGVDGLYQYNYDDLENIYQLSHIPIYQNNSN